MVHQHGGKCEGDLDRSEKIEEVAVVGKID